METRLRMLIVLAEYDGRDHVQRIEQWEKDLVRAGRLPGVPRRLRDDWRAHFPGPILAPPSWPTGLRRRG